MRNESGPWMGLRLDSESGRKKRSMAASAQWRLAGSGSHWMAAMLAPYSAMMTQRRLSRMCWRRGDL